MVGWGMVRSRRMPLLCDYNAKLSETVRVMHRERDVCMVKPPETVHFLHGSSTGMHHFLAEMLKIGQRVS